MFLDNFLRIIKRNPFLFYAATVASVSNGFVLPFLKQIHVEVTNSYLVLCLGEALFITALATMGTIWGIGFDRTNNKNSLMFFALEGVAIFVFLTSIASNPIEYLMLRLFTGFFMSAIYAFAMSIVASEYAPGERINTYMLVYLFMNIGVAIGTVMGAVLSKITSWRSIVKLYAILLGVSAPMILISKESKQSILEKNKVSDNINTRNSFRHIFKVKTNGIVMLQGFFGCIPWGAIGLFMIYAIMEKTGGSFISVGITLGLGSIFYPFSLLVAPKIDRMRKKEMFSALTALTGVAILAQAILFIAFILIPLPKIQQTDDIVMEVTYALMLLNDRGIILSLIIYGSFICVAAVPGPVTRNIIADINSSDEVATAVMLVRLVENLGSAVGLIFAGVLVDFYGKFISALEVIWISWIICAAIWFLLGKYYQEDAKLGPRSRTPT